MPACYFQASISYAKAMEDKTNNAAEVEVRQQYIHWAYLVLFLTKFLVPQRTVSASLALLVKNCTVGEHFDSCYFAGGHYVTPQSVLRQREECGKR